MEMNWRNLLDTSLAARNMAELGRQALAGSGFENGTPDSKKPCRW
jgi:hypothetical protein